MFMAFKQLHTFVFLYIFINNCRRGVSKTVELTALVESLPAGWARGTQQHGLSASACSSFPQATPEFGTFAALSLPPARADREQRWLCCSGGAGPTPAALSQWGLSTVPA